MTDSGENRRSARSIRAIDQEARDLATKALNLFEGHERVCTERWTQSRNASTDLKTTIDSLQSSIDGISNRIVMGGGGLIMVLLGIIGYLLTHHGL